MKLRVDIRIDKEESYDSSKKEIRYTNPLDESSKSQNFNFTLNGYNSENSLQPLLELIVNWFRDQEIESIETNKEKISDKFKVPKESK